MAQTFDLYANLYETWRTTFNQIKVVYCGFEYHYVYIDIKLKLTINEKITVSNSKDIFVFASLRLVDF
jgi:beta-galactosidase beta subunit